MSMPSGASARPLYDRVVEGLARGALLGAAGSLGAGMLDLASAAGWLSGAGDRARLGVVLALGCGSAGALAGAVAGAGLACATNERARWAVRAALAGASLAPIARWLFAGGRMKRLPAQWALQPLAWLALTLALLGALALALALLRRAASRSPGERPIRPVVSLVFCASALALHALDHRVLPRLYEFLHAGLGVLTALCLAAALSPWLPRSSRALRTAGALAALSAVPCALLALSLLERWENARAEVFGVHAPYARHLALAVEALRPPRPRVAPAWAQRAGRRDPPSVEGPRANDTTLPRSEGAHLLLLTVDAMRADRLGRTARDGRPLTPALDALAARGARFTRTYTQAPHSSYALSSLHTSEYLHETVALGQPQPLATIADALAARGYRTAALYPEGVFFTEGERLTAYRDARFGFHRADHNTPRAPGLVDSAVRELDETVRQGEPPTFLWVHFFDAHEPYGGEGPTAEARYDDALRRIDTQVDRLLTHARTALHRELVVALTADHGEEFGEHGGVYHGSSLYDEQVRVPLVFAGAGVSAVRVSAPTQLIDVAPTLLGLLGVTPPTSMRGRDLRPQMAGRAVPETPAFSAVNTRTMAVLGARKLVADLRYNVRELYDLDADPGERQNLAATRPAELAALSAELLAWLDALGDRAEGGSVFARARAGDRGAVPELLALAADATAQTARRVTAVDALAAYNARAVVSGLAPLLDEWGAPAAVRDRVASALGSAGDARALPALAEAITREDPETRRRAAFALARLSDPRATPVLAELVYSADESLRAQAVDALGFLRATDASDALLDALDDDHLRYRAALALGRSGAALHRVAEVAVGDRADDVRAYAAAGLGASGDRGYVALLADLLARDPAQDYAASALGALGALGERTAGWDARRPSARGAQGFAPCFADDGGLMPLYALGARACETRGSARINVRVPRAGRAGWVLVVRASHAGELLLSAGSEANAPFARIAPSEQTRQHRVALARGALREGAQAWSLRVESGPLTVSHVALVPSDG